MKSFPTFVLSLVLAATPMLALAQQASQDPNTPAKNTVQLKNQAERNKAQASVAKDQEKRSKNAEKASKKAASKESKAAKDQQKAAEANAAARPQ